MLVRTAERSLNRLIVERQRIVELRRLVVEF
jgi:hypothetical protein